PAPPPPPPSSPPVRPPQQVQPEPPPPFPPSAPKPNVGARLTGAMQRLKPRRPEPQPHEAVPTTRLAQVDQPNDEPTDPPTPAPTTIAGPLQARRVRLSVDGEQALADLSFT